MPKLSARGAKAVFGNGSDSHILVGKIKLLIEREKGLYVWKCRPQQVNMKPEVPSTRFDHSSPKNFEKSAGDGQAAVVWEKQEDLCLWER